MKPPNSQLRGRVDSTLRQVDDLIDAELVNADQRAIMNNVAKKYDIAITPAMYALIDTNDQNDPIAKQFVPSAKELKILPQESLDPIGDYSHAPMKALVHRHKDRVLLKPTNICAVYCRFCFRREMVGPGGDTITPDDVEQALNYIAQHNEISEVILTGGDPLMLSAKKLGALMNRLQSIPHIKWIRLHTRVPVVAPEKITSELLDAMKSIKPVLMAIHANHAREFTVAAGFALARLAHQGVVLLGQSVLLRGVNDSVDALQDLVLTMMQHRVKPYYLHHPDMTVGTGHFRLGLVEGIALLKALRGRVSGVCVPDYVLDIPGGIAKIPLNSNHVRAVAGQPGHWILTDLQGKEHFYQDVQG